MRVRNGAAPVTSDGDRQGARDLRSAMLREAHLVSDAVRGPYKFHTASAHCMPCRHSHAGPGPALTTSQPRPHAARTGHTTCTRSDRLSPSLRCTAKPVCWTPTVWLPRVNPACRRTTRTPCAHSSQHSAARLISAPQRRTCVLRCARCGNGRAANSGSSCTGGLSASVYRSMASIQAHHGS